LAVFSTGRGPITGSAVSDSVTISSAVAALTGVVGAVLVACVGQEVFDSGVSKAELATVGTTVPLL